MVLSAVLITVIVLFAPETINGFAVLPAVLLGLGVGLVAGGLGVGGAWLLVPFLVALFLIDIRVALGTGLAAQLFITIIGSYEHVKTSESGMRLAGPLVVGGVLGVPFGIWLNVNVSLLLLTWVYVCILAGMALKTGVTLFQSPPEEGWNGRDLSEAIPGRERADAVIRFTRRQLEKHGSWGRRLADHVHTQVRGTYRGQAYEVDTISLLVLGVFVGALKSLVGVAGALIAPFLSDVMEVNIHVATTASIVTVAAVSVPAAIGHALLGNVSSVLAGMVAVGGVLGAVIGANISEHLPENVLKAVLAALLLGLSYYMLPV